MLDREACEKAGWAQGAILSSVLIAEYGLNSTSLYVTITQSCDLLHDDLTLEPNLTTLEGREIVGETLTNSHKYQDLKHPRQLHLEHEGRVYEFVWARREELPRTSMSGHVPQGMLNEHALKTLVRFVTRKFQRPALASEFDIRVKGNLWLEATNQFESNSQRRKRLNHLEDCVHVCSPYLNRVLISKCVIEDRDPWKDNQDETNVYRLELIGILKSDLKLSESYKHAKRLLQQLADQLAQCPGIEIEEVEINTFENGSLALTETHLIYDADAHSTEDSNFPDDV
jgi:hypothetical protein